MGVQVPPGAPERNLCVRYDLSPMSQVGHDFPNSPCSGEFISPPSSGGSPGLFLEAPGFKPGVSVAKKGERRLQARGTSHQSKKAFSNSPRPTSYSRHHLNTKPPSYSFTLSLEGPPALCSPFQPDPSAALKLPNPGKVAPLVARPFASPAPAYPVGSHVCEGCA